MKRKCLHFVAGAVFTALLCWASPALAQTAPPLGATASFGVLGGSAVTASGPAGTVVGGDVGSAPTPTVDGFPPGVVTAGFTVYTAAGAVTTNARTDATTAYNNLAAQGCTVVVAADLSLLAQPLVPGVYCMGAGGLTGTITLSGTASDIWVFKTASSLTTAGASNIVMAGTASSCNVYWQVTTSATLGAASTFRGSIYSGASVDLGTTANVVGRAIAGTGAVTMAGTNSIGGCSAAGGGAAPPTVTKAFSPVNIAAGGVSTLTITLSNSNAAVLALNAVFTDTLPSGLLVATVPNATTTCGGAVTAASGGSTVTLAAASTIPSGSCAIAVDVTAATGGGFMNTIAAGALQTNGGNNALPATAVLSVAPPVPTLSEWAFIMLTVLLAASGVVALRRRTSA